MRLTPRRTTIEIRPEILSIFAFALFGIAGAFAREQSTEPFKFFREYVGLNEEQISGIGNGKAIAKVLESRTPDEVFVLGAVHVHVTPESYLRLASDIGALRKLPNYLAIRKFSDPPRLSDLQGFTLDEDDIKELKEV